MSTQENSRSRRAAGGTPLIREPNYKVGSGGVSPWLVIPAVVLSALINGGLVLALMVLDSPASRAGSASAATPQLEDTKTEAVVQAPDPPPPSEPEESKDPLLIDEVDPAAQEPDAKINYNNERDKEEFSVPGVVNRDEPIGILNGSKEAVPTNLPAPPGLGMGQGGALPTDLPGGGVAGAGMPGGVGGLRGLPLAGTFYGRSGSTREKALREGGGTKETEAAVARGLKWLSRQQIQGGPRDGAWPLDNPRFKDRGHRNDIAGTAFGLLPFLGAGFTHKKARNSPENPYERNILTGLAFLVRVQDKRTGNLGGGMYAHALATIALCEAYGLSQDPWLRRPAQMAVDYLVRAQHVAGGWRYEPGQRGDMSVTGWVVMALKSAQMANLAVPEPTMRKAVSFVNACCDTGREGYGYTGPSASPTMSAVGLLCRQYLQNWGSQNLRMIKGVENNIESVPPGAAKNMYYYYYASQVMHHFGGENWAKWNEKMRRVLLDTQIKEAGGGSDAVGSWPAAGDAHGGPGGRLMITSLSILTLEVYYRHLPLYYRDTGEKRAQAN